MHEHTSVYVIEEKEGEGGLMNDVRGIKLLSITILLEVYGLLMMMMIS